MNDSAFGDLILRRFFPILFSGSNQISVAVKNAHDVSMKSCSVGGVDDFFLNYGLYSTNLEPFHAH